jgi:hypothetical protein
MIGVNLQQFHTQPQKKFILLSRCTFAALGTNVMAVQRPVTICRSRQVEARRTLSLRRDCRFHLAGSSVKCQNTASPLGISPKALSNVQPTWKHKLGCRRADASLIKMHTVHIVYITLSYCSRHNTYVWVLSVCRSH